MSDIYLFRGPSSCLPYQRRARRKDPLAQPPVIGPSPRSSTRDFEHQLPDRVRAGEQLVNDVAQRAGRGVRRRIGGRQGRGGADGLAGHRASTTTQTLSTNLGRPPPAHGSSLTGEIRQPTVTM